MDHLTDYIQSYLCVHVKGCEFVYKHGGHSVGHADYFHGMAFFLSAATFISESRNLVLGIRYFDLCLQDHTSGLSESNFDHTH